MTAGQPPPQGPSDLRRRAECRVDGPGDAQWPSQPDTARLLHELQVRDITKCVVPSRDGVLSLSTSLARSSRSATRRAGER